MLEEVVQDAVEVDKEQVQQEEEEREEMKEPEISQQSPSTPQKHDTKVTYTCLTSLIRPCLWSHLQRTMFNKFMCYRL